MYWAERIHVWYYKLPDLHRLGLAGKAVDKIAGKIVKRILDRFLPSYYQATGNSIRLNRTTTEKEIICSLTTFPNRIESVWIAIESLFRQSVMPNRIILWLARDQFPTKHLPESIIKLMERGLEVEYCDEDLKAHKKYFYALKKYPDAWVITFDDDLYYDYYTIENVLKLKMQFPDCIVTNRAHQIRFNRKGDILPYRKWTHNIANPTPSYSIVATGGCGTLYEGKLLHPDVTEASKLKELAFYADDLWLKVMTLRKGARVVTNSRYGKDPIVIGKTQREKLVTTNVLGQGNDLQLQNMIKYYSLGSLDFQDKR